METLVHPEIDVSKTAGATVSVAPESITTEPAGAIEDLNAVLDDALMGISNTASGEPSSLPEAEEVLDMIELCLEEARTAFANWEGPHVKVGEVVGKLAEISDAVDSVTSNDDRDDVEAALDLVESTLAEARALLNG